MAFGGNIEPIIGYGMSLEVGDGGTPVEIFLPIAEIISITPQPQSLEMVDAKTITSPGNTEQWIPGKVQTGQLTFASNLLLKDEKLNNLIADLKTGTLRNFRLIFPDGDQSQDADSRLNTFWEFSAYVIQFAPTTPLADRATASIVLQPNEETVITT